LLGHQFELVNQPSLSDVDWLFFFDRSGAQCRVPISFTSLAPLDPFVVVAAGRSDFRLEDLLKLVNLVGELKELIGAV
jgi:Family of unknown function (DUF5372)